jgi:hypothetical protein
MKKKYLSLLAGLLASGSSFAQNTSWPSTTSTNNVGIGTTQPTAKLEVNGGDIKASGNLIVSTGNATGGGIKLADDGDIVDMNDGWATHRFSNGLRITNGNSTGSPVIQLANGVNGSSTYFNAGNVGIGITDPKRPLDVSGDIMLRNYDNIDGGGASIYFTPYGDWYQNGPRIKSYLKFAAAGASKANLILSSYSNGYKNELTLDDGNVGVGMNPDSKLSVNGTIHTREVRVDTQNFPDFVFKPTYSLPSLTEVKNFIDQTGHLSGMPSEAEAIKEGINLGEMNKKLLQKVEELTLYLIQLQKDQKQSAMQLTNDNLRLQKQINTLSQTIKSKSSQHKL